MKYYSPSWNTRKDTTLNKTVLYNVVVELVSQDTVQNESYVNVTVHAWRPKNDGYESYGTGNAYATVNGTLFSSKIPWTNKIVYGTYDSGGANLLTANGIRIQHDEDGSKQLQISAYFKYNDIPLNSVSNTYAVELPKIDRYGLVKMTSNTINVGETTTILVENLTQGDTVSVGWIDENIPSSKHTIFTEAETETSVTYAWDTEDLLSYITSSISKPLKIYCDTIRNSQLIGTTYFDFTAIVPEIYKPDIITSIAPINTAIPAMFANEYIINISKISIDFSGSTAEEHTIISEYGYVLYDASDNIVSSQSFESIDENKIITDIITAKISKVKAYIKDTRGYVSETESTILFNEYALPYVSPVFGSQKPRAYRAESGEESKTGTELYISAAKKYSALDNINSCKLEFSMDGTNWTTLLDYEDEDDYNGIISGIVLNKSSAYTVFLKVTDKLNKSGYYNIPIPKAFITFKFGQGGTSISFGTYETEDGVFIIKDFDIDFKISDIEAPPEIKINGFPIRYPTSSGTIDGLSWKKYNDGSFEAEGDLTYIAQTPDIFMCTLENIASLFAFNQATYNFSVVIDDYYEQNNTSIVFASPHISVDDSALEIELPFTDNPDVFVGGEIITIHTVIKQSG